MTMAVLRLGSVAHADICERIVVRKVCLVPSDGHAVYSWGV